MIDITEITGEYIDYSVIITKVKAANLNASLPHSQTQSESNTVGS
jgi:hypothetical protein